MAEKKEWRGIQLNKAEFQGTIIEDPVFNGEYAFLKLRTIIVQRDANGQVVELDQIIPLMVEPGPLVNVVRNFVKAGRKLHADCQYRSWDHGAQHALVASRIILGDKPYEASAEAGVPLPPS